MSTADLIRTTGSAVTVITGAILIVVFLVRLDGRVGQLEEKVHTLTLAPVLSTTAKDVGVNAPQPTPNPVAQACADLARKSADEISQGFQLSSERIRKTMADMGCVRSP